MDFLSDIPNLEWPQVALIVGILAFVAFIDWNTGWRK